MFIQHESYIFDPAKISFITLSPDATNIYVTFVGNSDSSCDFSFANGEEAHQFIDNILFGNVIVLNKTTMDKNSQSIISKY